MLSGLIQKVLHLEGSVNQPLEPTEEEKEFLSGYGLVLSHLYHDLQGMSSESYLRNTYFRKPFFNPEDCDEFIQRAKRLGLITVHSWNELGEREVSLTEEGKRLVGYYNY